MERWEHESRHLQLWADGDRSEEHLAKVMWFCATQIELERLEREGDKTGEIDLDDLFHGLNRKRIAEEVVVDTLKDVGVEVGSGALLDSIRKLIEVWGKEEEKKAKN